MRIVKSILINAPADKHTVWAYGQVPHGSSVDTTGFIENQIERFILISVI